MMKIINKMKLTNEVCLLSLIFIERLIVSTLFLSKFYFKIEKRRSPGLKF